MGTFMRLENIGAYSPKFKRLLEHLITKKGRSFIYTNRVTLYGVDFIAQMLRENGIISHSEMPQKSTLCYTCKHSYADH